MPKDSKLCVIRPDGDSYGWVLSTHKTLTAASKGLQTAVAKRVKVGLATRIQLGRCAAKTGDRVRKAGDLWLRLSAR